VTTEIESDLRVKKHAETLIRRGTPPEDAKVIAAGREAQGRLTGVDRVRLAAEGHGRHGVSDAQIIAMGEAASREANHGIPFHVKIARCANSPTNEFDEMQKALQATQATLQTLQADVAARRSRQPTETPRVSPRAGKMPLRSFPPRRPGHLSNSGEIPAALPRLIGPSQAEHDHGWNLDLAYHDFRDRLAGDIRQKRVRPTPEAIIDHTTAVYGLDVSDAAEWTERFLSAVDRHLQRRA
jgi:hypothetical protein